ncbi:MAG: 3-deoxy-7-phosphoheptulonate synthase, partial [Verrucomicrobiae bacterium]|nr:3-deoxy-7-phosphoheptulonate synthase [Verrucomicrobiae bacterium]
MIIVLKPRTSDAQLEEVVDLAKKHGYEPKVIRGVERTIVACVGDERSHDTLETFTALAAVESVTPIQKKYKLVSREFKPKDTVLDVHGIKIGSPHFAVIAGPCSVE